MCFLCLHTANIRTHTVSLPLEGHKTMQTWYEKHQRSRAAADAKQKAFTTNEADKIHLRDASWESRSVVKITKADIARRIQKRKERLRVKLEE